MNDRPSELTHFDEAGRPRMVDVSDKDATARRATASGDVFMSEAALNAAKDRDTKKGDPIAVAELAGVMAAKRTADLIPLCHPLPISAVQVTTQIDDNRRCATFTATVKTTGKTGVEMEALTAVSGACLALYDMLKAVDKTMSISNITLLEKTGGASGDYVSARTGDP